MTIAESSQRAEWTSWLAAYLVLASLIALPGLGSTGLVMMEGMVADTSDTMLETGELLTPRLYGELFTYKPPLAYWTAGLSTWLFGRSEWSLRLPSALAGILMGLVLMVTVGRVTRPPVGLLAGLASLSGLLFLQKLKIAEFDAQLAAAVGIAIALACFELARQQSSHSTLIWAACYAALACAFLVKGMPALMAFSPGLLLATLFAGRLGRLVSTDHLIGLTLFGMIAVGYLVLAWQAVGPEMLEQPLEEARARGFEWTSQNLTRTLLKPALICIAFLPWSLAWFWRSGRPARTSTATDAMLRAAWGFLIGGSLAFVLVPTLENRYFLPLCASGAIVSAISLAAQSRPARSAIVSATAVASLFAGGALIISFIPEYPLPGRVIVGVAGLAALVVVYRLSTPRRKYRVVALMIIAALSAWIVETWALRPRRAQSRDLRTVASSLAEELPSATTVWTLGPAGDVGSNASLYYYLERPVRAFRSASELPQPGAYVVLSASDINRLTSVEPTIANRLRLVRRVDHSRRMFLLYRVVSASVRVSNVQRTRSPVASWRPSTRPLESETP